MRQPVWILNSSLLVLFFMSQLLLFMLQKAVPRRTSIIPDVFAISDSIVNEPVNLSIIYGERDLFGTHEAPIQLALKIEDAVIPMPIAPKNIDPSVPVEKTPTFFAPLDCILKGVIFVQDDPSSSLAIIQFKKTKEEENYQVGDLLEDAQILKILPNRVMIIRSNGQQETLYLREEDAIHDFDSESTYMPKNVVESTLDNKYKINIDEFVKRVPNLGEFINVLDLTTVYRQGKSFGCRVGSITKDSLGGILGFITDDIIVKIDGFDIDDLASRITVYNHILTRSAGDIVEVEIQRGNDDLKLIYGLVDYQSKNIEFNKQEIYKQLTEKHVKPKNKQSEQDSVVIQRDIVSDQQVFGDLQNAQTHDDQFNELAQQYFVDQQKSMSEEGASMPKVHQKTLHETDAHKKRLMQEHDKLTPTIKNIKTQDRQNMLKQTNRNIIFNGMVE